MNKTKAIQLVRKRFSDIYKLGDSYKFNFFDSSVNCWRESHPENFFRTQFHRSANMVCEAMHLMGFEEQDCFSAMASYINGSWTDHLNDMIKKYSIGKLN